MKYEEGKKTNKRSRMRRKKKIYALICKIQACRNRA